MDEPAPKRQKLSPEAEELASQSTADVAKLATTSSTDASQLKREAQAGILHFVSPQAKGFSGVLKQRFTDFLVNEITTAGEVVHLTDDAVPGSTATSQEPQSVVQAPEPEAKDTGEPEDKPQNEEYYLADDDKTLLASFFDEITIAEIQKLHDKALRNPKGKFEVVVSRPITDREARVSMHQAVRRIFHSRLETSADSTGAITIKAAKQSNPRSRGNKPPKPKQLKGRVGWDELGGEYLHFTLLKENRDTMDILGFIASRLNGKSKLFGFAGTKDKRGVTVQRVSGHRVRAEQLGHINQQLSVGNRLGDFSYHRFPLALGDLSGNEFLITLRDCKFEGTDGLELDARLQAAKEIVEAATERLQHDGFINYYGLQRFGTFAAGTDDIGMKILKGDFEGAVNMILSFSPDALDAALHPDTSTAIGKADAGRAHAIHTFLETGKAKTALALLPGRFAAERSIMSHLGTNRSHRDFLGALLNINRNLRLMYVHAYQSLVWNMAASERWARYGAQVVAGDLVLYDATAERRQGAADVDADGEVVVHAAAGDVAITADDLFQRARPLSADEAASGQWTVFDVVLPTPGFDVEYPRHAVGDFYRSFMASARGGGLDPHHMRRPQRDFSLSGSYRALMGRTLGDVSYEVRSYRDVEQLVQTDLERLEAARPRPTDGGAEKATARAVDPAAASDEPKIAVVVKLQLGTSQYATMALRELMKLGIRTFKPEFSNGR